MFTQCPRALGRICGGIVCIVGVCVIIGWIFDIAFFKNVFAGLVTMKFNTAIGMMLGGVSLSVLSRKDVGIAGRFFVGGLAVVIIAIAAATLGEYLFGWNLGIDEVFVRESNVLSNPGRMSPSAGFCFILVGVALVLGSQKALRWFGHCILWALATTLVTLGAMAMLGQVSNVLLNFHVWNYFGMAIHTAAGFLLLGVGILGLVGGGQGFVWALDKGTTAGFAMSIMITLTVAGVSWNSTHHLKEASRWVSHTQAVLKEIQDVQAGFAQLESSQRGYLILGDENLLTQRLQIKAGVDTGIAVLETLTADNPHQKPRLDALKGLGARRMAFGEETIRVRREHGFDAARKMLAGGTGIALSREIQEVIGAMRDEEYVLLALRQKESDAASTTAFLLLPLGVFVGLAILLIALFFLNAGIAQQKQAEQSLMRSLREVSDLKTALDEHAQVAITDAKGKITYVNDKFCAISKYAREELLGRDHRIINSGHHSKAFTAELWATISSGRVWHGEIRNKAKDRTFYWVDTTIVPFLDESGKPWQYVVIRADITQSREAAEEILRLNASLEQRVAERTTELEAANKELGAFSYSVSHDLRAPLRAVDGFSQAVLEDYGDQLPEEGRKYLMTIREGAQRMGILIDDLLAFSKLSRVTLNKQEINTRAQVLTVIEGLNAQAGGRAVEFQIGDLPACNGAPGLLDQVWVNLLSNAVKYTRKCEKTVIQIGCDVQARENVFFVRDNGAGFDMRYADKLFGVFQRLHRTDQFEGTGVGLAIVQRIVHRHGGRIWAQASVGHGATFYFTLEEKTNV